MKILGVIPARWASTRFEGKVLAEIHGRPMIQHVWQRAKESRLVDDVIIACDDERVLKASEAFGARAVMTAPDHLSGTDRIAEAVAETTAEIIINIQGDEPLISSEVIDSLVQVMIEEPSCVMASAAKAVTEQDDVLNANIVKVVFDHNKNALYFSRAAIPFDREQKGFEAGRYYKHLGLYAYRKEFLCGIKNLPPSKLEAVEKLEQLRILEAGYKIKMVETTHDAIGVDTPEDLRRVIDEMSKNPTHG